MPPPVPKMFDDAGIKRACQNPLVYATTTVKLVHSDLTVVNLCYINLPVSVRSDHFKQWRTQGGAGVDYGPFLSNFHTLKVPSNWFAEFSCHWADTSHGIKLLLKFRCSGLDPAGELAALSQPPGWTGGGERQGRERRKGKNKGKGRPPGEQEEGQDWGRKRNRKRHEVALSCLAPPHKILYPPLTWNIHKYFLVPYGTSVGYTADSASAH